MYSLRTKTIILTVTAIIAAIILTTVLSVFSIRDLGNSNSKQMIYLLCENGKKNLEDYFDGMENSVEVVASLAENDLTGLEPEQLENHIERTREIFEKVTERTNGVLTYYYRIDPEISDTMTGFWYTNLTGEHFDEHEVTDITQYDTNDTSKLVWFTVPKATGEAIWLSPYVTDNLDVWVMSYSKPIYWHGQFIGVMGMEIDYSTMAELVDNISLYENGYAFLNDDEGNIIYHPHIDAALLTEENKPKVPEGLLSSEHFIEYNYEGVEKQAVWLPLSNGMRLNVTVPVSELNRNWLRLIQKIVILTAILLVFFIIVTTRFASRITKPLRELAHLAEQVNEGNYDFELEHDGKDEVGVLTRTIGSFMGHMKTHVTHLSSLAYIDSLTSVRNKTAYDIFVHEIETMARETQTPDEFAVVVFDCDNLKTVNDRYGHDKGDLYLKNSCRIICTTFKHSPVFRTGGDEFIAILEHSDFHDRDELVKAFRDACDAACRESDVPWEQISVSLGMAVYDRKNDTSVRDIVRHADRLMYKDKISRKMSRDF